MKTHIKNLLAPAIKRAQLCFIVAILLLSFSNTKAQDDCKDCGLVMHGILVDSLHCYNATEKYYVFPINPEWFKYDAIEIGEFKVRPDGTKTPYRCKFLKQQEFIDNFGKGQLGILRIPMDKVIELVEEMVIVTAYRGDYILYEKEKGDPDFTPRNTVIMIRGRYIEGSATQFNETTIKKTAAYGKPTILWQSKPIPGVTYGYNKKGKFLPEHQSLVYDADKPNLGTCTNKGKAFPYKMEAANYSTEYFIVKTK